MTGQTAFVAMRNALVDRGLLTRVGDAFRLTPAGDAYVEELRDRLRDTPPAPGPAGPDIRWNFARARGNQEMEPA